MNAVKYFATDSNSYITIERYAFGIMQRKQRDSIVLFGNINFAFTRLMTVPNRKKQEIKSSWNYHSYEYRLQIHTSVTVHYTNCIVTHFWFRRKRLELIDHIDVIGFEFRALAQRIAIGCTQKIASLGVVRAQHNRYLSINLLQITFIGQNVLRNHEIQIRVNLDLSTKDLRYLADLTLRQCMFFDPNMHNRHCKVGQEEPQHPHLRLYIAANLLNFRLSQSWNTHASKGYTNWAHGMFCQKYATMATSWQGC